MAPALTRLRQARSAGVAGPHRDLLELAELKALHGSTVSVCLPARNEEATVGAIVNAIHSELVERVPLVDEILVLDDGSSDATAAAASRAGAFVIAAAGVLDAFGPTLGKGDVLWRSLAVARGDLIVWCDADLVQFDAGFVAGLLDPLLSDPTVVFVKGSYTRPERAGDGGGRVTELVAKPLLSLLRPDLAHINQPLGGEYAGRRDVLELLSFEADYGVEMGLLVDIADLVGVDRIAQVDLGVRLHRSRSLQDLAPQAASVARALLRRCQGTPLTPEPWTLRLPGGETTVVTSCIRPPLASLVGIQ